MNLKNALIIILCAAVGSLLVYFILTVIGIEFNKGLVGGISGAIFGGLANSYLTKKGI